MSTLLSCRSFDAKIATQEMLLDDFMEGMIQGLFMEKWERFGEKIWLVHRGLDLCYLVPLVINALWLKEAPLSALQVTMAPHKVTEGDGSRLMRCHRSARLDCFH